MTSLERLFEGAKTNLDENEPVIVVGIETGGFVRVASTKGSVADAVLLLERAKAELLLEQTADGFDKQRVLNAGLTDAD